MGHCDGINGTISIHVTDVQSTECVRHVDNMGTCLSGRREGVGCWEQIGLTVKLDDGDVVVVSWVRCLASGVIDTFTSQEPNVFVVTLSGEALLRFSPVSDFEAAIGIGVRCSESGNHWGGACTDWTHIGHDTLVGNIVEKVENDNVIVAVLVDVADSKIPCPEVSESLANGE